jgi:6-pyruvoyltetrahydropterin/6-carboxytetrahydropterin synthase
MFELKVVTRFAAAHQLKMVAKKCENLHGHNWKIEVFVGGNNLNSAGVLMDFGLLKEHIRGIICELDHTFLNDLEFFNDEYPPSSENIAYHIAKKLQNKSLPDGVRVTRVSAWESDDSCATYIPSQPK